MATPQEIIKRYDRLFSNSYIYKPLWQDLAMYIQPFKATITVERTPGQKMTETLYDSTAIHANELLAATLHGTLTSDTARWFSLKMRDEDLNSNQKVKEWLEQAADRMYAALNQSNFAQEIDECYLDLGAFGNSALFVEEKEPKADGGFGGVRFMALGFGKYVVDENAEGRVDVLFREFQMSARACMGRWPKTCGPKITQQAEMAPESIVRVIHGVYPGKWTMPDKSERPFYSAYVVREGAVMLEDGGFHEFPFMAARWRKYAGEIYGRGPGHVARPDILSANKAKELDLKAFSKSLDPPMGTFENGVVGGVKMYSGAVTVLKQPMGAAMSVKDVLAPIQLGIDYKLNSVKLEELRASIKQAFFTDQLEPLGSVNDRPDMTATEATIRNELMLRLLGPTAGRLQSELLSPLVDRCFSIMYRAGRNPENPASAGAFPDMPEEMVQAVQTGNLDLDVRYEGILARAQQSSDVVAIQRFLQFIQALVPIYPDAVDKPNFDKMIDDIADSLGVRADSLNDDDLVKQVRALKQQQAQQQQAQQATAGIAQAAGNAAPMVDSIGKIAANPTAMNALGFGGGNGAPAQPGA